MGGLQSCEHLVAEPDHGVIHTFGEGDERRRTHERQNTDQHTRFPLLPPEGTVSRIIAVANQKGGVAKTTTVASLGGALTELGRKVLLVDLDPQACLTYSLGLDPEDLEFSMHDVLLGRVDARLVVTATEEGPDLLPATIDLAGTEAHLLTRTGREYILRLALEDLAQDYDVVLLDCSPSLGVLTVNALTAADEVLIPMQCETLSHRGVRQLLDTVQDVRDCAIGT
jgi:chromosome partitioning protein